VPPALRLVYSLKVTSDRASRTFFLIWLLCATMVCLTVDPPHCNVCDRLVQVSSSSKPLVHQHVPATQDTCNGLCDCCGLHAVLASVPSVRHVEAVAMEETPQGPMTPLEQASFVFRPPRIALLS
jgi:hypothetical protein